VFTEGIVQSEGPRETLLFMELNREWREGRHGAMHYNAMRTAGRFALGTFRPRGRSIRCIAPLRSGRHENEGRHSYRSLNSERGAHNTDNRKTLNYNLE
jgi:hypothetical protein